MFYANFAQKNQKEIELKDVDREEFVEMLHVIYPSNKMITDDSAEYLLKLADRFQISTLTTRVEKSRIHRLRNLSNLEKLRLAYRYRLCNLKECCLTPIVTEQDFKDVKHSPISSDLSNDMKTALFERVVKTFEEEE
ncbi:hypothetical protein PENTCL1PPCAC_3519 [Pristionchus entomophagus]|uniref:BTB domain-containing protein n=1 Tax=Pristionchus entomophagus TaxID=358040 RepID=A0AAV5SIU5_9BILA|nr:hypothetical protein PENTCL1PPCAC_3519 [Pristionchus entomophagus]